MTLYIDTTNWATATVGLRDEAGAIIEEMQFEAQKSLSNYLLANINTLLSKHNAGREGLTAITVVPGPGSFTGTRIGVAVANSIGFALDIPVNGKKDPVIPVYNKEPAITQPK